MSDSIRQSILAKLILGVFVAGAMGIAGLGVWKTWQMSRQLAAARQTTGVVLSSKVLEERHNSGSVRRHYYIPSIQYEYEVSGTKYVSTTVYPGGTWIRTAADQSQAFANKFVRKFAEGKTEAIWYLPNEPETSFLVRIRRVENGWCAIFGGLFLALGAPLLLPMLIAAPRVRLWLAMIGFISAQSVTWLLWTGFITAPPAELRGTIPILSWLTVAYVVICWAGLVAYLPPSLEKVREATIAAMLSGTLIMALSTFIVVPLMMLVPSLGAVNTLPWVGIGAALLGLFGWATGVLAIGKPQ